MTKDVKVKSKYVASITGYCKIDNGNSVYRLIEKMTAPMRQDELAEFYESEKKKGNPLPMSSIQHIELVNDAVKSGNKDLMNYLQKGFRKWPGTLTRVIYNPIGEEDETIHNYGTSDAYSIIGNVVGRDDWIKDIDNPNALESLLKTKDIKILNEISNAINQTSMYFSRLNSKPAKKTEATARFYANDDGFNFSAGWSLSDESPAFLVVQIK